MLKSFTFLISIFFLQQTQADDTDGLKEAYCVFVAVNNSGVSGHVIYKQSQQSGTLMMRVELQGLNPNSKHGFHIHEKGDMTNGCSSQGGHYNPTNQNHGGLNDTIRHLGDLGNVQADSQGNVNVDIVDTKLSLSGEYNIIGRGCSLHGGEDDLGKGGNEGSIKSGNSGNPIACGEIKQGDYNNILINYPSIILLIQLIFFQ